MKRKLKGIKRSDIQLDFNLYRVDVPIPGLAGPRLSVIDIRPEGVERTILFVHGYAGCAETWEHQVNHFSRDFRVVVPDLRGHGQSDAPLTQYTMAEMVADLFAITQALALPGQFILVGHSFGGSICVEYATAHPEQLERLVLIATAGEYPLPKAVSLAYRLPTAVFQPWWKYRPRWNAEPHVLKRMALNNMSRWQGWNLLRDITTPTLVITGERDNYFPRYVFDDVGNMVAGAEVVDVGVSKHKVQLERHEAVNRAIERFAGQDPRRYSWRERGGGQGGEAGQRRWRPWFKAYSKETPETVPIPRQPLSKFLEGAADWMPRRAATVFYGSKLTYKQLDRQANQFAHVLLGLGVQPGDRVMIAMPNIPQLIVAYYGALRAGGVVVLPNPDADASHIVAQARQTEARVLVTLRDFTQLAEAARQHAGVQHVVLADVRNAVSAGVYKKLMARWRIVTGPEPGDDAMPAGGLAMADLMRDASYEPPGIAVDMDSLAAILFTSGTVGEPKGAALTHTNLVANAMQTRHWIPDLEYGEEVFLSAVPLSHSYGMTAAMNLPIAVAATVVLLPVFELDQVLEHIQTHKPTIFPGVPSMYGAINQAPDVRSYGLSSIKACISGAAPLPVEVQEAFEKLTRGRLVEGYGLTEASPVTHANPLYGTRKSGSIGVPIPNTDAKIVDLATGADLAPGQVGELAVRGPQVMAGYWGEQEADETTLQDGWLFTGDVATVDADGYFRIIGRKRDTIMAGEFSVFPRDVEEVLYENSKVQEVAVVGVPHAEAGQKVKAYVVPRPGSNLSQEELLALCRRRLDEYAVPWEIEFREELPKSFVGKVLRRMLVEEEGGSAGLMHDS